MATPTAMLRLGRWRSPAWAALIAFASYRVGRLHLTAPSMAFVVAAGVAGVGATLVAPGLISVGALPATFLTYRVGAGALNMSISDLALVVSLPTAFAAIDRRNPDNTRLFHVIGLYLLVLLVVIAVHPTTPAVTEWIHRAVVMAGGVLVGASLVRYRLLDLSLRYFLAVASVFSLAAIAESLTSGFAAAYPLGVHKNAAGGLLAMAIVIVATAPLGRSVPASAHLPLYLLFGAGLVATKSRGAGVGVVVVFAVIFVVRGSSARYRLVTGCAAAVLVASIITSAQNERAEDVYKTQAIAVRERQYERASKIFADNRVAGAGIRYFKQPRYAASGQASSLYHETSAESGIVGLVDVALLIGGVLLVLRRVRHPLALTAAAVFGVKVVHSMFDVFWVSGPFSLPWLLMGAAVAMAHQEAATRPHEVAGSLATA